MSLEKMMWMIVTTIIQVKICKTQAVIEEVNDRDLEKLVEENDFVAVAWFQIWSKDLFCSKQYCVNLSLWQVH